MRQSIGIIAALAFVAATACNKIPGTDAHKIESAHKRIVAQLTDPLSAQFRDELVIRNSAGGSISPENVCGMMNAKNRIGGYVGFTRYIASTSQEDAILIDPSVDTAEKNQQIERDTKSCAEFGGYSCQSVSEAKAEIENQKSFEEVWTNLCTS